MSRKYRRKNRQKAFEVGFIALLVAAVVLVGALIVVQLTQGAGDDPGYVVTQDGHVHAPDGTHIGTYEEVFGEGGYVVTEGGHVHAPDGTHVGTYEDAPAAE